MAAKRLRPVVPDAGDPITIAPLVAVGYCDIGASGCRALFGLAPPTGGATRQWALEFEGMHTACVHHLDEAEPYVIKLVTVYDATEAPVCSAIVVLGAVPEIDQMVFSAAVMDFIDQFAKTETEVVLAAAVRIPVPIQDAASVFSVPLNGCALSASTWKPLPPAVTIPDALLCALLHTCQARGQKALLLAVAGHRLPELNDAASEEQMKLVRTLGEATSTALSCQFSEYPLNTALGTARTYVATSWLSEKHEAMLVYT